MKKTIIGIIIGLLVGIGAVGAYLHFSNPKDEPKNKKEENKTENKEEVKKDEYYQFYFENGKIYYSLNKGEKKYLMDGVNKEDYDSYLYDKYLYDDDKLYYYTIDTNYNGNEVTGYKYNFSYIDLNTKKKNEKFNVLEVDATKQIHIRKIDDNKVYYAYTIVDYKKPLDSEENGYVGIEEYNFMDKTIKKVIERKPGVQSLLPYINIYNGVKYVQLTDGITTNIYKIENGKEEIIVKDVRTGTLSRTFNILNDKLYYIDNDLLFSYNLKDGSLTKESETLASHFGNALIYSDMIAYVDDTRKLHVKTNDVEKEISLTFSSNVCTECNNIYISNRINENELLITAHYSFSTILDLNSVANNNLNVNTKQNDGEDSIYNNRYFEYRR